MAQLIIKNIGPIKDIDITLNKINVIIGPQSSGKSTINKIACFCSWVEKKVSLDQSFDYFMKDNNFLENLVTFHKLEGYFSSNSEIRYTSEVIKYIFVYNKQIPTFEWVNQYDYIRTKISYIPAERNIVSMIADWKQVNLPKNNIFNFMSDWNMARKIYSPENNLNIDYLKIKYFYDESQDVDFLETLDGNKIQLINASSGQQSMIPLYILINYFTKSIYEKKIDTNIEDKERNERLVTFILNKALSDVIDNEVDTKNEDEVIKYISTILKVEKTDKKISIPIKGKEFINSLTNYISHFTKTNYSSLFIEEPELNLFPSTQKELLYFIINAIKEKEHNLFLTTHSPYILYSLNNCIMGWLVKDNMPNDIANSLESHNSWINPKLISVWQIKDGEIFSIQEPHTNSIGKHYFNEIMNETMDEYYTMLNYFTPNSNEK
jgi:predicted ATPase